MTIYKISIANKTDNSICVKIENNDSVQNIDVDQIITIKTDSTITNLYIYECSSDTSDTKTRSEITPPRSERTSPPEWQGVVPSNTYLEVYKENGKYIVYLENQKVPPNIIQDLPCSTSDCDCTRGNILKWVIAITIILLVVLCICGYYAHHRK